MRTLHRLWHLVIIHGPTVVSETQESIYRSVAPRIFSDGRKDRRHRLSDAHPTKDGRLIGREFIGESDFLPTEGLRNLSDNEKQHRFHSVRGRSPRILN